MTTIIGRYARAEAVFPRHHSGDAPERTPPLRPLWKDILAGVFLAAFIGACVFV